MASYKVEVFSGDGTTFIRPLLLRIPDARKNGAGYVNKNPIDYSFLSQLFDEMETSTTISVSLKRRGFTFFLDNQSESTRYASMLEMGFNVVDTYAAYANQNLRFKFSNGNYCYLEYLRSSSWCMYRVYYYKANGTLVTGPCTWNIGPGSSTGTSSSVMVGTFPFVCLNEDGTATDFMARSMPIYIDPAPSHPFGWTCRWYSSNTPAYLENLNYNLHDFIDGIIPIDDADPYVDIPDSEPSGPAESTGIPENDPIAIPDLPTVSVTDTGFITLFNPTLTQVNDLASYMWTGLFDLATYKKIFADPMDCILGFNMLPVAIPHGTAVPVRVGNISTGVNMDPATSQWVDVDCGTLDVGDAFGNYLSYAPYTKFSMYLPYIGMVELSADDVVGKTLALKYHVDVLSCSCVAYLKCGPSVLYQFTGSCGYSIPVSGNDFRATIANIVSITATVAGAVVTGGAAAGITAGTTAKAAAKAAKMKAAQTASHIGEAASVGKNVMGSKPEIHRSGAIGSSAGIMGMQKPFLIVEYPNPCKPKKQYHYTGYPSFVTVKLSDLSGYAAFEEILIEGVSCTETEQAMIKELCAEGIFL